MNRVFFIIALLCACADKGDLESCPGDKETTGSAGAGTGDQQTTGSAEAGTAAADRVGTDIVINVDPNNYHVLPPPDPVTFSGTLEADIRIDRLLVGGAEASGTRDNFATWTITRTAAQLERFRDAGRASIPVVAVDVCGGVHPREEDIEIMLNAATGTPAPGLTIALVPDQPMSAGEPECYLPADGSATATMLVVADVAAAGVRVSLSAATEGEILGATEGAAILEARGGGGCPVGATTCSVIEHVKFRPTEAGTIRAVAASGGDYALDDSGLEAEPAPEFIGASGTITPTIPANVRVRTGGRLDGCTATSAQSGLVSVARGSTQLIDGVDTFDDVDEEQQERCGQIHTFEVVFDAMAPVGLPVEITCTDTYEQARSVVLTAGAAPEPP